MINTCVRLQSVLIGSQRDRRPITHDTFYHLLTKHCYVTAGWGIVTVAPHPADTRDTCKPVECSGRVSAPMQVRWWTMGFRDDAIKGLNITRLQTAMCWPCNPPPPPTDCHARANMCWCRRAGRTWHTCRICGHLPAAEWGNVSLRPCVHPPPPPSTASHWSMWWLHGLWWGLTAPVHVFQSSVVVVMISWCKSLLVCPRVSTSSPSLLNTTSASASAGPCFSGKSNCGLHELKPAGAAWELWAEPVRQQGQQHRLQHFISKHTSWDHLKIPWSHTLHCRI